MALTVAELARVHERVVGDERAPIARIARDLGIKPDTLHAQYRRLYPPVGGRRPDYMTPAVLVVVRLHVLKGGSVASIARELGLSPITVRKHYRRAVESGWLRSEAAAQAFRDWRWNARARDGLDRLIAAIRASWVRYPTLEDAPASVRPMPLSV